MGRWINLDLAHCRRLPFTHGDILLATLEDGDSVAGKILPMLLANLG